jgi:hypothetical protein
MHTGFNELSIKRGVGYIQEIHMFTSKEVPVDSPLIPALGKLFSPYPGILFTPSSSHQTPVFKKDGSVWDFDELVLSRAEKYTSLFSGTIDSGMVVAHAHAVMNNTGSAPSFTCSPNGGSSGETEGNGSGRSRDSGRRQEDQNPGGQPEGNDDPADYDPDDPNGKRKATVPFPDVSFDVLANIYCNSGEHSDSSALFQELQINGKLTTKVSDVSSASRGIDVCHILSRQDRPRQNRSNTQNLTLRFNCSSSKDCEKPMTLDTN